MTELRGWIAGQIDGQDRIALIWALWLPLAVAVCLAFFGKISPHGYIFWIENESHGLLELSHWLMPLAASLIAMRLLLLRGVRRQPQLFAWLALAALGTFYVAGEEMSWGQHYFDWVTPEGWHSINDQGETNLHNTSSWFDQKPRTLLEIGVIVGGLILPWLMVLRPALKSRPIAVIVPPLSCFPAAALAELSALSERTVNWLGGETYLFHRTSEVQEFYFYYFVLLYIVILSRRLVSRA